MKYISKTTQALGAFVLATLIACGWLFFDSRDYNHRRYLEQSLEGIARLKASAIETWRDTRLRDAEMLALNPVLRDAVQTLHTLKRLHPSQRAVLVRQIRQQMLPLQLAYEYKNIRIVGRSGQIGISLSECCFSGEDAILNDALQRAWFDRAPVLSDVHLDADGQAVMNVIVPLFLDEEMEDLGLSLNLVIDPSLDFFPSLQEIPIPSKTFEALLVRREGDQIRFITPLRHRPVEPLTYVLPLSSPNLPAALGLLGRQGVVSGQDYRKEPVLAVSTHLRDTPWVLIVKMDRSEALTAQRRETRFAAVGVVTLAVAVLALIFLSKTQMELSQSEALQRAQANLLDKESRLASVLRAAPIGVGIAKDHQVIEANEAFCSLTGYTYEELLGRSVRQLYPSDEAFDQVVPPADKAMAKTGRYTTEAQIMRRDATVFDALVNTALIKSESGRTEVCFTVMDISGLKAQEAKLAMRSAELERSNEDLTTFAYVASHDLRSPLRGINQLSEWIRQDMPDTISDEIRGYLDLMANRIQRMENLLDDLLEYSRVGRIEGDIEEVSIEDICHDNFDLQQPPANFALKLTEPLPTFVTLSTPLTLIFRNLISNALKHNDKAEGWVEIRAADEGDMYRFFVVDNGPGIAAKYHDRIFALFQTLRPRDEVEGSGMGLAIIRRILEAYSGDIQVISDGEQGTEFVFTWPKEAMLRRLLDARKHS